MRRRAPIRALLATCLACGWLLAAASPAAAAREWGVVTPDVGETLSTATDLVAFVVTEPAEQIERVEVRFARPGGEQYGDSRDLVHTAGSRSDGTSTWTTSVDPLASWAFGGGAMGNGTFWVETRVVSGVGGLPTEPSDWQGHPVHLKVPPPQVGVTAAPVGTRTTQIRWSPVDLPDFERYAVERAAAGGDQWQRIVEVPDAEVTQASDTVAAAGQWRYRVLVVRADGAGGELTSTSDEVTVTASDQPSTPPPADPTGPAPPPGQPAGDPAGPGPPSGSGAAEGPAPAPAPAPPPPPPQTGTDRTTADVLVPQSEAQAPPLDDRQPSPPPGEGAGQDVFEETLGYSEPPAVVVTETERQLVDAGGFSDGGTLTVLEREFETRKVLTGLAGMLVLFVSAGHVLRLRGD